jgi:hypothetical protein
MKKHISAKGIPVDAGIIMLSDPEFYNKWKGLVNQKRPDLFKSFDVKNGKYEVKWKIKKTWNGDVKGEGILEITSGKMIVSDPCYHFHADDSWDNLLNKTDYLKNEPEGTIVLDKMGGDGVYNVQIMLEEVTA